MAGKFSSPPLRKAGDLADALVTFVAAVTLTLTAIFLITLPANGSSVASRDFVEYWATGQQLVHHANPYDWNQMKAIERDAGLVPNGALIMFNPPWALPLVFLLGFCGVRVAFILWTLLLVCCLGAAVRMIRTLHGSPIGTIHWIGLAFPPALACLIMGQTSFFPLLGVVTFFRLHTTRPFVAGLSLWLCALKPHLLLPFIVVLLAWILISRSYKIIAGFVCALVLTTAIAYLLDPHAWSEYSNMMRSPLVRDHYVPSLGFAIRGAIQPQAVWIEYIPAALGCAWALVYFWHRRNNWNWTANGSLVLMVSLLMAPYCWFYDQTLAIPAVMRGAFITRFRWAIAVFALLMLLVDVEFCKVDVASPVFLWNMPVWLAWYLLVSASPSNRSVQPAVSPA